MQGHLQTSLSNLYALVRRMKNYERRWHRLKDVPAPARARRQFRRFADALREEADMLDAWAAEGES